MVLGCSHADKSVEYEKGIEEERRGRRALIASMVVWVSIGFSRRCD